MNSTHEDGLFVATLEKQATRQTRREELLNTQ